LASLAALAAKADDSAAPGIPRFVCRRCGRCCRGRGGVWLSTAEMRAAAQRLSEADLAAARLTPDGAQWRLGVGLDGRCAFYLAGCRLHPDKPRACRQWPFFYGPLKWEEAFLAARDDCPGLGGWTHADFLAAFAALGQPWPPKSFRASGQASAQRPLGASFGS
jgi:Fe-S-cluster containining protein